MDNPDAYGGSNGGLANRYSFTQKSQIFDMEGPLYEDVFRIDKYLVNGGDLHLKVFYKSCSRYHYKQRSKPKLQITAVRCFI